MLFVWDYCLLCLLLLQYHTSVVPDFSYLPRLVIWDSYYKLSKVIFYLKEKFDVILCDFWLFWCFYRSCTKCLNPVCHIECLPYQFIFDQNELVQAVYKYLIWIHSYFIWIHSVCQTLLVLLFPKLYIFFNKFLFLLQKYHHVESQCEVSINFDFIFFVHVIFTELHGDIIVIILLGSLSFAD